MARPKLERLPRPAKEGATEAGTVKSAARTLQILEFFDVHQREASVVQVADALGIPQSSTSGLLSSLVAMGYLHYDRQRRTYITSMRVALLGSWLGEPYTASGGIVRMMRELSDRLGESVGLLTRNGPYAQYVHVVEGPKGANEKMRIGATKPLTRSGAGYAVLSTLSDAEIKRLVLRLNSEAIPTCDHVQIAPLLAELAETRRMGFAARYSDCDDCGIVAKQLPKAPNHPPLVVGICGKPDQLRPRAHDIARLIEELIYRHLSDRSQWRSASVVKNA